MKAEHAARERQRLVSTVLRTAVIGLALLVLIAVALPHLTDRLRSASGTGDAARLPNPNDASPLLASNSLDMTQRPRLSDRIVLRVTSQRTTFWRGETFDRWDGRYWTRSDTGVTALTPDGGVRPLPNDLAASGNDTFEQRFQIASPVADLLFGAATPIEVDAPAGVFERADGAMLSLQPLGSGASYTITSRRVTTTEAELRATDEDDIPSDVLQRYAAPPTTTERVRKIATQVTGGADNNYDRIIAMQKWMGERTRYSLDAPLAPKDADVVDDFLFESREGWCEQIASTLVVLARQNGIPARLVTGFTPGQQDRLTGDFVVREKNAHAWTEVWFPSVGWVPFDPTADVPLAGDDKTDRTWSEWLASHTLQVFLAAVLLAVIVGVGVFVTRRIRARRRQRTEREARDSPSWAGLLDARLETLGARAGRARSPGETATTYARSVAAQIGAPDVGEVGRTIDGSLYAPRPPTADERATADEILGRYEADESLVPQ